MVATHSVTSAFIVIDSEKCKGCGYCVSVCPKDIIAMGNYINKNGYTPALVMEDKTSECTGCLACTVMCPEPAISAYLRTKPA